MTRNTDIIFIGGRKNPMTILNTCERLNTLTNEVLPFPSLNEARSGPAAVIFDDKIIVTGGFQFGAVSYGGLSSVESFSFVRNVWTLLTTNMPRERNGHCACVFDGKIFIIGGSYCYSFASGSNSSIDVFDPTTGVWSHHHDLHIPRHGAAVAHI